MPQILGNSKIVGVFGHPVGHSVSPAMHNAAFEALGMDWFYMAFDVRPDDLEAALRSLAPLGIMGVNLTIPHKERALEMVDEVSPEARRFGGVNTVRRDNRRLIGYNTDGVGFLGSLAEAGFDPKGKRTVVLGAGGAARSVVRSLADGGAADIAIFNRSRDRAQRLVDEIAADATRITVGALVDDEVGGAVAEADLVVNATPIGMSPRSEGTLPIPATAFHSGLVAYDLIYNPPQTRFLAVAAERGCRTINGIRMLALQGAESFRIWSGRDAPVAVMERAVTDQLGAPGDAPAAG
jgi:shikimate dehydrogenase